MNLSLKDVGGNLLLISQFTLYANCTGGNRPDFLNAAKPEPAKELYEYIINKCKDEFPCVQKGIFGTVYGVACCILCSCCILFANQLMVV